jgi:hypothetical protein
MLAIEDGEGRACSETAEGVTTGAGVSEDGYGILDVAADVLELVAVVIDNALAHG